MQGKDIVFAQLSDFHIKQNTSKLDGVIEQLNRITDLNFVVVTGDTVHDNNPKSLKLVQKSLDKIRVPVFVIPGETDCNTGWGDVFGESYFYKLVENVEFDFVDTSYLGERYFVGWADTIEQESEQQADWLKTRLLTYKGFHVIFSHHPMWGMSQQIVSFAQNNVRAIYSGHLHVPVLHTFPYTRPINPSIKHGFSGTILKFHGNGVALIVKIGDKGDITHYPQLIDVKVEHTL